MKEVIAGSQPFSISIQFFISRMDEKFCSKRFYKIKWVKAKWANRIWLRNLQIKLLSRRWAKNEQNKSKWLRQKQKALFWPITNLSLFFSFHFISWRFFSFFVSFAEYYLFQTFCWHHISKNQKSIFAYPYQRITKSLEFNSDLLLLQISWKSSKDQKHLKDRFASD